MIMWVKIPKFVIFIRFKSSLSIVLSTFFKDLRFKSFHRSNVQLFKFCIKPTIIFFYFAVLKPICSHVRVRHVSQSIVFIPPLFTTHAITLIAFIIWSSIKAFIFILHLLTLFTSSLYKLQLKYNSEMFLKLL